MRKVVFLFGAFFILLAHSFGQVPATATEAAFFYWDYSPTQVYGVKRLTMTAQRSHVKIAKINPTTVRVRYFSANGQPGDTTTIRFTAGRINQISYTNRWGHTYEVVKLAAAGPNELMLTSDNSGSNPYLPAKGVRYIYKAGLLAEARYVSFEGRPIADSNGVATYRYTRYIDGNRYGRLKEVSYFDENDKPVVSRAQDCHKIVYEYDPNGDQTSVTYLGTDDEPLTNRFGGYRYRYTYDEADRLLTSMTIGLDDKPPPLLEPLAPHRSDFTRWWPPDRV